MNSEAIRSAVGIVGERDREIYCLFWWFFRGILVDRGSLSGKFGEICFILNFNFFFFVSSC